MVFTLEYAIYLTVTCRRGEGGRTKLVVSCSGQILHFRLVVVAVQCCWEEAGARRSYDHGTTSKMSMGC